MPELLVDRCDECLERDLSTLHLRKHLVALPVNLFQTEMMEFVEFVLGNLALVVLVERIAVELLEEKDQTRRLKQERRRISEAED